MSNSPGVRLRNLDAAPKLNEKKREESGYTSAEGQNGNGTGSPASPQKYISVHYLDRPKSSDSGERSPLPLDVDFPTKEIVSEENGIKVITKVYETPDGRSKTVTKKSITEAEDGSSSTVTTVTRKTIVSGGRTFKFELDPKGPANVDDVNVEVPLVEEKVKPKHSTPPPALPKTPPPSQLPDNPLKSQPSPPIQSSPPPAQPKKSPPKSSPTILPVIPSQTKTPTTPPAPQPQKETPAASPSILPSLSPITTTPNKPSPPSSPSKAPVKKKSEKVLEIAPVQPKVKKDWSNRPKYFGTSLESDVVAEKEIQKTKLRRQQSLQEPIVLTKNQELKAKKIQVAAAGLPRYKKMLSSSESRANRLSRAVSEQVWFNRAEEIVKSEIGQEEYNKRLEKQNKLFEEGAKKGGFFDGPSMYFTKGSIKSLFEKKTKASGLRATHHAGVGALGYAVIDNDPRIPKNDFFAPGRVFEIRARHSNFPNADNDAKMGNRSLSLKFADHETESPLDFILQTGYISPFFNAESIEAFHSALQKGNEAVKGYFTSLPVYLEASLEGLRYLPDSYYHQFYHSQMVYDFKSSDDVRRVARFRVVPADGSKESGRLSPEEQREVWYSLLLDRMEQDQPSDYLREEFKKRINQTSALDYSLQMQIHEFKEGDTNIWYNASLPWDSETHPWIPLATIVLETLLPEDVVEVTRFNVGHTPKQVLDFPEATSNADFNTVPNIRKEVYELASKLRPREPREPARGESVEYLIHTVTGTHPNAGNMEQHSNVYVSIIGSEGRTPFMKLTRKFKGDFDKGNTTTFGIISKRVGELRCAKVFKERKGSKSDWFLEYMVISTPYNNKCHTLPCYRWFNEKVPIICLRDGTGVLDHMEPDHYMRLMRTQEITLRQMVFQWRDQSLDPDFEGLPGYLAAGDDVHALPNDMWTPEMKKLDTEWQKHLAGKNSLVKQITNLFKGRKGTISAEFEETVADSIAKKDEKYHNMEYIIRHWRDDAEFARQMVNGLNPMKITALTSMPATFPLKEHAVKGLLEPGRTLQQELQAGRLFLISYPELEEFVNNEIETEGNVGASSASVAASRESMAEDPYARSFEDISEDNTENMTEEERKEAEKRAKERKKEEDKRKKEEEKKRKEKEKSKKKIPMTERRKYLCAPMLILYLKGGTEITPLAIQLTQTPEDPSHPLIYTPNDNNGEYSDWMVAKMWVRVADSNLHQVSVHLLGTHLMIEPIAIATVRQLPSVHPVFKLLVPFLKKIVAINTIYRKWVMPKDGAISEVLALCSHGEEGHLDLMKKQVNRSKFSLLNVPNNFSARGVLDESCLPGFYYRDDVLKLWAAIQDYVTEILALYYEEDEDVEKDDELASMIDDLRTNGFNNKVELPGQFVTLEELVNFCTIVIFRCTGQHAAVSRGMLDIYGYCPNAPPCMMKPFPTYKRPSGWTEVEMKELLPPIEMMERYIGMVMLLFGGYDDPEVSVGKVVEQLFTEEAAMVAIKHFQDKLAKISKEIHVRNENIDCPYTYLLPENIPSFIDI